MEKWRKYVEFLVPPVRSIFQAFWRHSFSSVSSGQLQRVTLASAARCTSATI